MRLALCLLALVVWPTSANSTALNVSVQSEKRSPPLSLFGNYFFITAPRIIATVAPSGNTKNLVSAVKTTKTTAVTTTTTEIVPKENARNVHSRLFDHLLDRDDVQVNLTSLSGEDQDSVFFREENGICHYAHNVTKEEFFTVECGELAEKLKKSDTRWYERLMKRPDVLAKIMALDKQGIKVSLFNDEKGTCHYRDVDTQKEHFIVSCVEDQPK